LAIRQEHGNGYMSDDFQWELAFLGMTGSPSFVGEPEGNGVAERFFRTLEENPLWVRHLATSEELRLASQEFRRLYNQQWLVERLAIDSRPACEVTSAIGVRPSHESARLGCRRVPGRFLCSIWTAAVADARRSHPATRGAPRSSGDGRHDWLR
jgi:hypothetical protein